MLTFGLLHDLVLSNKLSYSATKYIFQLRVKCCYAKSWDPCVLSSYYHPSNENIINKTERERKAQEKFDCSPCDQMLGALD